MSCRRSRRRRAGPVALAGFLKLCHRVGHSASGEKRRRERGTTSRARRSGGRTVHTAVSVGARARCTHDGKRRSAKGRRRKKVLTAAVRRRRRRRIRRRTEGREAPVEEEDRCGPCGGGGGGGVKLRKRGATPILNGQQIMTKMEQSNSLLNMTSNG